MRSELLQNDVGGYLEENIWHEEYGQCYIVLRRTRGNSQVFLEAEDDGIGNICTADRVLVSDAVPKSSLVLPRDLTGPRKRRDIRCSDKVSVANRSSSSNASWWYGWVLSLARHRTPVAERGQDHRDRQYSFGIHCQNQG